MVYFAPTSADEPARFGYIVSKTVGKAHERNLVRRRLKAASQELIRQGFAGANVIVRALPGAAQTSWAELAGFLATSLGRQGEGHRA